MPADQNGGGQGQESGAATQGQGQESTQGEQQQGQGQGQESGASQQQQGTDQGQFSLDAITDPAVRAYVEAQQRQAQEARQEAARYRTERNTLVQQNETEQERIAREATERQERLEALEQENRSLKVGQAIQAAASDAKAFNPVLVAQMLDAKVTLGDDGKPTNLQDLLKDLRQSDPYLFKRADTNAGEGKDEQSKPTGSMNDVIRSQVAARRGRS
jgi:hypothetical protein